MHIENVISRLESIKTGTDVERFEYMRSFTNLGISKSEIVRAGIKIKYRLPVVNPPPPELTRNQKIAKLISNFRQAQMIITEEQSAELINEAGGNIVRAKEIYMDRLLGSL